jgi:hypothetical protein
MFLRLLERFPLVLCILLLLLRLPPLVWWLHLSETRTSSPLPNVWANMIQKETLMQCSTVLRVADPTGRGLPMNAATQTFCRRECLRAIGRLTTAQENNAAAQPLTNTLATTRSSKVQFNTYFHQSSLVNIEVPRERDTL